ncbi:TetR family transcriptional regulator [Lichenihabitans sp. Uapishka_5]|uniref:TetR/AcrR family transcriptional regulator n=1 Tax=Lichenihabitans sp. Uapishka_5 TaxID=3037302 RepID=UPI0029E7E624|nr:TetR family transcriptional regulator [Lichenihabitans sp. Uapishka_5]MDX7953017.1 TetR family transcriptional regulator [Lichenihabitans sp. Uapishka_5]
MNVHSPQAAPPARAEIPAERRTAILDAGERCFVLHGFHRATMQDLAKMAGMSVGNLYRYFPSKDAVVLALAERDRAEAAKHLCCQDAEQWPMLIGLLRQHLRAPRQKAMLLVELWAEGTRNPTIAAMLERFEAENRAWVAGVLAATGAVSDSTAAELADRFCTECQGIAVNRALFADYDPMPPAERLIRFLENSMAAASGAAPVPCLEPVR